MSTVALATTSFVDRVTKLLEQVDYRRADTAEERDAIFRLRYDAYLREGAITPNFTKKFADTYDDQPNAWIFGVYLDGQLVSSMRLNVTIAGCAVLPALNVFADVLTPEIEVGKTIIDPTRFVVDRNASRIWPELPYVTIRLALLASEYFGAQMLLATVRTEHQAFYRRLLGHRAICPPRPYPTLTKPIACMTLDYGAARDDVQHRYPFFRSIFFERRMLFERTASVSQLSAA